MGSKLSVVAGNLQRVRDRIAAAARRSGRAADEVDLLPVTKTVGVDEIRVLLDLGVRRVGESRVLDAAKKAAAFASDDLEWHLIGHLQRNKVSRAIEVFSFLHSLDSVRLAQALSGELVRRGRSLPCLLEVNTTREPQKHGFRPDELRAAADAVALLPGLRVEGLMTMAMLCEDPEEARPCFALLRELAQELRLRDVPNLRMKHLSMGMSQDFEVAVEEGATVVRVGTALLEGVEHAE
ncbi:MAG: YggS family pyridoxal phosphate-dependent enzyme [Planctomycetota bacterium]